MIDTKAAFTRALTPGARASLPALPALIGYGGDWNPGCAATHWITDNRNSVIAVAPGSFQSELGCSPDWLVLGAHHGRVSKGGDDS